MFHPLGEDRRDVRRHRREALVVRKPFDLHRNSLVDLAVAVADVYAPQPAIASSFILSPLSSFHRAAAARERR